MEIKAKLNYLRMSPRKVRLAAGLIRGMQARRADLELQHLPKRAAGPLRKLLNSALANARHNFQIGDDSSLYVKGVKVNAGPVLKRFRPRAFGRAAMIRRRTSHVSLVLDSAKEATAPTLKAKSGPAVREFNQEGFDEETKIKRRGRTLEEKKPVRSKPADFVRRVFRRKAI